MTPRKKLEKELINKANENPQFREALLNNPHTIIQKELTEPLPKGIKIHVLEETSEDMYFVLPPAPSRELADTELESITGGGSIGAWDW